jgi:hypothetical protein
MHFNAFNIHLVQHLHGRAEERDDDGDCTEVLQPTNDYNRWALSRASSTASISIPDPILAKSASMAFLLMSDNPNFCRIALTNSNSQPRLDATASILDTADQGVWRFSPTRVPSVLDIMLAGELNGLGLGFRSHEINPPSHVEEVDEVASSQSTERGGFGGLPSMGNVLLAEELKGFAISEDERKSAVNALGDWTLSDSGFNDSFAPVMGGSLSMNNIMLAEELAALGLFGESTQKITEAPSSPVAEFEPRMVRGLPSMSHLAGEFSGLGLFDARELQQQEEEEEEAEDEAEAQPAGYSSWTSDEDSDVHVGHKDFWAQNLNSFVYSNSLAL